MDTRTATQTWIRCDKLYTPYIHRRDALLRIENGRICQILDSTGAPEPASEEVVHEPGAIIAPGFIDLHVHGARGRDLMDGTRESLCAVSEALACHGTTGFLATTLSAPDSDTETALRGITTHRASINNGAVPLGIHMEGPYLNPVRRGTHNGSYLRAADRRAFRRFVELANGAVLRVTVAPEMDDGFELIREAVRLGVKVSIGHSDATESQARAAVDAGASQATHTFNVMRPFHQREPGILGLVLLDNRVDAEVIADGVHVHWSNVNLLVRLKGLQRTLLVTDGLSSVDMPDGSYPLGDKTIVVRDGQCRDQDGVLAGSTLTLDRAVRNLVSTLNLPLEGALAAASAGPARSMGFGDRKGVVAPGADADLVFLDPGLNVIRTMVAGRTVYKREAT